MCFYDKGYANNMNKPTIDMKNSTNQFARAKDWSSTIMP